MSNAFKFAFAQNSDAVVVIGTDSPTFPAEFLEEAFEFLEADSDIVMGKSEDGGFYLIGLRKIHSGLFENVAWSSPKVFEQTARNAERLNLRLSQIENWYDVDTPADLVFLRKEMLTNEKMRECAPETFRWFAAHSKLF